MSDLVQIDRPLPDIPVQSPEGQITSLATYLGNSGTLLNFIHGTWCPQCVNQLRSLQRHQAEIVATGARIVVIMTDAPEHVAAFKMTARPPLNYTVLADPDNVAHRRVGVDEAMALIVVDAQGIVRHIALWHAHEDHPGYQAVLQTLQDIGSTDKP